MYLSTITLNNEEEALGDVKKMTLLWESKSAFENCLPYKQLDCCLVDAAEQVR